MWKLLRILAWTAGIIAGLIFVLRLTAIRWWQVPDNDPYLDASISPTLRGGDWIVLWRASLPKVGDLVLCPEPKTNRPVLGRIVGAGGDQVQIVGGALNVNHTPTQVEGKCDTFHARDPATGGDVDQSCSFEIINDHKHARGNLASDAPTASSTPAPEYDVPQGQFFLLSDNRALPYDSRDFGTVDHSQCVETVVFRLVSKDGFFDVANRLSLIR